MSEQNRQYTDTERLDWLDVGARARLVMVNLGGLNPARTLRESIDAAIRQGGPVKHATGAHQREAKEGKSSLETEHALYLEMREYAEGWQSEAKRLRAWIDEALLLQSECPVCGAEHTNSNHASPICSALAATPATKQPPTSEQESAADVALSEEQVFALFARRRRLTLATTRLLERTCLSLFAALRKAKESS